MHAIKPGHTYVVTFKEKHGNRVFVATSEADLKLISLIVLRDRVREGWYCDPSEATPHPRPDYTDLKEIEALRGEAKADALKKLRQYQRALLERCQEAADYAEIMRAAQEGDGAAAFNCLEIREDGEYEGFSITSAETFDIPMFAMPEGK